MVRILRMAMLMVLMSLLFLNTHAQTGFIEESVWSNYEASIASASDFVILPNGKKLFGQIQRNYDVTDYSEVVFIRNGNTQVFQPKDLYGFGLVNGRFFLSKTLSDESDKEFVQVIFSGKLQLDYKNGNYYIDNGIEIQKLRTFYQVTPGAGTSKQRHIKLYISTLKILTAGECGFQLTDLIEKSKLAEQDLIRILIQFHECEHLPYKLHVEKIPFVKFSPTIGVGVGTMFIKSFKNENDRASKIDQPYSFQAEAGFKLHDFRRSPRVSFDLRFKYQKMSSTWLISQKGTSILVTGSQEFSQESFMIPLGVNFSFYKRENMDVYFGLRAGLMFNSLETEDGYIDFVYLNSKETYLSNMNLLEIDPSLFVPGLKLGSNIPINEKRKVYAEIQADYVKGMYLTYLPNSSNVGYNNTLVSFNVGFEF